MLNIKIPKNFNNERIYIIKILIDEYLGLKYNLNFHDKTDYEINLPNKKKLVIKDDFFSKIEEESGYLKKNLVPQFIYFHTNLFLNESDIPVIYGNELMSVSKNEIICGIDIFSSSFFMLTRWEEHVSEKRDVYNRFPSSESIASKFGFLDRPVVNEYVEMLWNMLVYLGIEQTRKKRKFKILLTHDVDLIERWKSPSQLIRSLGGDLIKRKSLTLFIKHIREYILVKRGKIKDPFDTFDWIMDLSDKANVQSRFYFMSGGVTPFDNHYIIDEPNSLSIIKKIKARGHMIGFHPSFDSYNNKELWETEKRKLEQVTDTNVMEGRQHFLRFEVPVTWQIWSDIGMEMDSTLGYADKEGFRCGTCYEFPVFNILTRKQLNLKEYPLILMEVSFMTYQNVSPKEMETRTMELMNKVKKYDGNFVCLWHNSNFNTELWNDYKYIYTKILQEY